MEPRADNTEEQVRRRAFELWEEHGRPEGYDEEFWLQAERQLKGGANPRSDANSMRSAFMVTRRPSSCTGSRLRS